MEQRTGTLQMRLTITLATLATVLTGAVLLGLSMHLMHLQRRTQQIVSEQLRLRELAGDILRLDEVLTMSARMAAATGQSSWEERYWQHEPILSADLREASELARRVSTEHDAAATEAANQQLVAMESRAFELIHAGKLDEAHALLSSAAYDEQKRIYSLGMQQTTAALTRRADRQLAAEQGRVRRSLGLALVVSLMVVMGWLAVLGIIRGQQAQLLAANSSLDTLNRGLDRKVMERTSELLQANRRLAEEVEGRKLAEQVLEQKVGELEMLNRVMSGREERILELKREVNDLLKGLGRPGQYEA